MIDPGLKGKVALITGETSVLSPGDFLAEHIRRYGEHVSGEGRTLHCIVASYKIPWNQVGNLTHQLFQETLFRGTHSPYGKICDDRQDNNNR